jgi:signal transduction histidine kinase
MSLKTKFLILLSAIFVGLLLINFTTLSLVIYPTFEELETREAEKNMARVIDILESDIKDMDSFVYDWAAWDDTYNYVEDRNQPYVDANYLPEYSASQNHDLYYIWDAKGKPVLNKALNEEGSGYISFDEFPADGLPTNHPFLNLKSVDSNSFGLIQTRQGAMIIAARPIINSKLQGPIRGILAMGRYLDEEFIVNITKRSHLKLDIWSLAGNQLENIPKDAPRSMSPGEVKMVFGEDKKSIFVYSSYPDIYGNPVILLKVSMPRDIVNQGKSAIEFGQVVVLFSGVVIILILFFILQRSIVSPLSSIARDIIRFGKRDKFLHQLPLDRNDELGIVARAVLEGSEERDKTEKFLVLYNRELKDAHEKLIEAKDIAEKASQAKSEFLSRMSHELRTPMNAIMGFTQLLQMDSENPLVEYQRIDLDHISSAGEHLLALINEVLDLAKIESGNLELSIKTVDIIPIVDNVISISKPLADENRVSLEYQRIPSGSFFVEIDPLRFKQIIINLVSNAIKYNNPNGSVIISYEKQENGNIRIGIRDTGHGIGDDKKSKLFMPFERLDMDADCIQGTGVGLAISKKLIELMNGTIDFDSVLGEGSFFYIDIPLSKKAPSTQVEMEQDVTQPCLTGLNKKKVLYIEDIPANVELVRQIFAKTPQVELLSALNAWDGIQIARNQTPDLILMDIHLPGMDGITAFKKLQTIPETCMIPVIALTADAMDSDLKMAMGIGFHSYITKPINVPKFLSTIDDILG